MADHDDDLAILLHAYRVGSVYLDLLGQLALPAAQRLAMAGVEGAAQAAFTVAEVLDEEASGGSARQLQAALRDMLFEEGAGGRQ
jgi:hypothetical protein